MADDTKKPTFDDLFDDEIVIKDASGEKKTVRSSQLSELVKEEIQQKKQQQQSESQKINTMMLEAMERILQASGIDFQDDEMMQVRFKNIILARLKKLREKQATLEALQKPRLQGGLTLVPEKAQEVSDLIESEFKHIYAQEQSLKQGVVKPKEQEIKVVAPVVKPVVKPQAAVQKMQQLKEELAKPVTSILKKETPEKKEVPVMPVQSSAPEEKPMVEKQTETPIKKEAPVLTKKESITPKISRPQVVDTGRPRIEDVKYPQKLVGPLDELRAMSLTDFRRLSSNPVDATAKLAGKFALLEDESYEKRMKGILSYFGSPLFETYIQLGLESLEKKMPLEQLYVNQKEEGLTQQEFLALNQFHSSLV